MMRPMDSYQRAIDGSTFQELHMPLPALAAVLPQALSVAKPLLELAPMALKGLKKDDQGADNAV